MVDYYYHYTSRQAAQEIITVGMMRTGSSSQIYITDELYTVGQQALDQLAITGKALEIVFCIPKNIVQNPSTPIVEQPQNDGVGRLFRRGGGTMISTAQDIPLNSDVKWISLHPP